MTHEKEIINLTGKIINSEQDYLANKKSRFYFVFKDENGKEVEAFPITSKIEFKNNSTRYLVVKTAPWLPEISILLSDNKFKTFIEKELARRGFERTKDPRKRRKEYKVTNSGELFRQIKQYSKTE